MKHLMKHLTAPAAFVVAFLMFGTPSAPGVAAIEAATDASIADVGGCAMAYGPGEDDRDLPTRTTCRSTIGDGIIYATAFVGFVAGVAAIANPVGILIGLTVGFGGFSLVMSTASMVIDAVFDEC